MKWLIIPTLLMMLATKSQAAGHEIGFGSIKIDPHQYGVTSFWCNAKTYYTDVPMANFQGCDAMPIAFGRTGASATLITAYYDWHQLEDGSKTPKQEMFIHTPQGDMYRLLDKTFLASPQLQLYFDNTIGRSHSHGATNIRLENFSTRHLQLFGNTFCVAHYLKHPFKGTIGWCQNDRLVSGEAGYLGGAMTFSKAAILAQNYIYEQHIPVRQQRLFHATTVTALNTDQNGYLYWAFASPAMTPTRLLGTYIFRVYFNGRIELREFAGTPEPHQL